jgi:hypothetical protein
MGKCNVLLQSEIVATVRQSIRQKMNLRSKWSEMDILLVQKI